MKHFIVHGHFYQPPREDPITGIIPHEPGALPYPNWNERIHAECYRPNADLGNFEKISFNLGPTLCAWMEVAHPDTLRRIVEQDARNLRRYGVGNAMAQPYNHTILPLASYQDKLTQVAWGIADFTHRFRRKPEGIWLPETAVDMETLRVLADQGIQFTILAPWQAHVEAGDPGGAYRVDLPGGRKIIIFLYHQELSARVSFDASVTSNADQFVATILRPSFDRLISSSYHPSLVTIASDGELYGHHQVFRDRFLAHLLNGASTQVDLQATYPALWLKMHPPEQDVRIRNETSWSCHHGVARWTGNCDCTPNNGNWKTQLRNAFDRLATEVDGIYQDELRPLGIDPWRLRNRYIEVLLGQVTPDGLIQDLVGHALSSDQIRHIHLLLEAQRERQRMYTSCGWFFEDFDRIEPKNNVAYAAQVIYLIRQATGIDLAPQVRLNLRKVVSARTGLRADLVLERHMDYAQNQLVNRVGFAD